MSAAAGSVSVTIPGDGADHAGVVVEQVDHPEFGREVRIGKATFGDPAKLRHLIMVLTVCAEGLESPGGGLR